jgi:pimeloyl-ACP methyl ester carboxylesterase
MEQVGAGANDWADVVISALDEVGATNDVILVGHSLAGLGIPVIASRMPVQRMIFLCALVPTPKTSWSDYLEANPSASIMPWGRVLTDDQGRMVNPWDLVWDCFYQDCGLDRAKAAFALTTPVAYTSLNEKCPLDSWPEVPSTYILCQDDRLIGHEWSRQISLERFGGPAIELPGSHSPMLSRPEHLAQVLLEVAQSKS